jgi:hypothetical protein
MLLGDNVREELNDSFEKTGFPMKIDKIFFYRPKYFDSYHEDIEPFHAIEKLYEYDYVYVLLEFHYEDLWYEYEIRYKNINNRLENIDCILKYWELMPDEKLGAAELRMTPLTRLFSRYMIPNTLQSIYEKKKEVS